MHVRSRPGERAATPGPDLDPAGSTAGPPTAAAPTAGGLLRAARTAAGMSLEQVSRSTRIRQAVVLDLEADRFGGCGAAVYARGHLRALAHAVGADPCAVVEAYGRQTGHPVPPVPAPPARPPAPPRPVPADEIELPHLVGVERQGGRWSTAVVAALSLLAAALALDTYRNRPPEAPDVVVALPSAAASPVAAAPKPAAKPVPKPAPTAAAVVVRVAGRGSWVRVSAAGRTLFEGTAPAGWTQAFTDPAELRVRAGNAGAVALTCAGKDLGPVGAVGAVVTVRCGRTGVVPG